MLTFGHPSEGSDAVATCFCGQVAAGTCAICDRPSCTWHRSSERHVLVCQKCHPEYRRIDEALYVAASDHREAADKVTSAEYQARPPITVAAARAWIRDKGPRPQGMRWGPMPAGDLASLLRAGGVAPVPVHMGTSKYNVLRKNITAWVVEAPKCSYAVHEDRPAVQASSWRGVYLSTSGEMWEETHKGVRRLFRAGDNFPEELVNQLMWKAGYSLADAVSLERPFLFEDWLRAGRPPLPGVTS